MSDLAGSNINSQNPILRFCLIAFLGSVGLGLVLSWKATHLVASEYQDIPQSAKMMKIKNHNLKLQQQFQQNLYHEGVN